MLIRCSLAVLIALSTASFVSAQRHGGGGGHVGAAHSGFQPAPGRATPPTLPAPIGLQTQYAGYTGINPGAYGNNRPYVWANGPGRGERNRGVRGGIGYVGGYGYYPFYDTGYASADPGYYQQQQDPNAQTDQVTASLVYEEQRANYQPPPMLMAPQPQAAPESAAPSVPIVVVLRDGKRMQVQNFAVMNGVLWDFTKQGSKKIPLASIDLAASQKASEEVGAEFPELSN